jgi:hypothetical protein
VDTLDGAEGADGHEDRGGDLAVVGADGAGAGVALGVSMVEVESHWGEGKLLVEDYKKYRTRSVAVITDGAIERS